MTDDRDYAGMYEIEPDVFALRVHIYEDDAQMNGLRGQVTTMDQRVAANSAEIAALKTLVEDIKTLLSGVISGGRVKITSVL